VNLQSGTAGAKDLQVTLSLFQVAIL